MKQPKADGKEHVGEPAAALRAALEEDFSGDEAILQWPDLDKLAVADIDYHSFPFEQRPEPWQLQNIYAGFRPTPLAAHVSHGRGVKLYYTACDGFTARELATAAAVIWCTRDGRVTVEIKRDSRHPLSERDGRRCSPVAWFTQAADVSELLVRCGGMFDGDPGPDAETVWEDYGFSARLMHFA